MRDKRNIILNRLRLEPNDAVAVIPITEPLDQSFKLGA
jgi:hypothetical protein